MVLFSLVFSENVVKTDQIFTYTTSKKNVEFKPNMIVLLIIQHLFPQELESANDIAVKSTAHKTWNQDIEEFKWRVAEACECLLAVFEVKKTAANLQKLGFPPDSDKKALETVLEEQMPNYKAIIKAEVRQTLWHGHMELIKNYV